jgi:hypothetical protein
MSAIRSLSGGKRTSRGQPISVGIDPTETLASPDDNALDTGFCPIKAFTLAAKMPFPELGVDMQRRGFIGLSALRLDAVIYPSSRPEEETREITRPHRWLHPDLERLISAQIYLAKSSFLLVLSCSTCLYLDYAHCVEGRAIPSWRPKDY